MKKCKGCSHPTICKSHGCAAEEARLNKVHQEQIEHAAKERKRLLDRLALTPVDCWRFNGVEAMMVLAALGA